ncbi:hypothetical protein [Streptomyces jumonjinensis]|nr:hypothetical protein [Streptomyces jumonjinensis]
MTTADAAASRTFESWERSGYRSLSMRRVLSSAICCHFGRMGPDSAT